MKNATIWLAVLVVAAALGWLVHRRLQELRAGGKGVGRERPPVAVEVTPVRTGPIRDVRVLTGTLEASAVFTVAPKVAGRIESLSVDIGDRVARGQEIGHLEAEEYAQRVEQARAELAVTEANVDQCIALLGVAQRDFERIKALREKKISSESDYDSADAQQRVHASNCKVAEAQVAQKAAALRAAEVQLSYTRILAVWEGGGDSRLVAERFVDPGAMLRANDPIVSIVDVGTIRGLVYVVERDYSKVRPGQRVTVATDAFPGREFPGAVARVAPMLRETSRQARVQIDIPNPELLLKPGMFIRARLEYGRREDAVLVPVAALIRRNDRAGVFTVDLDAKVATFVPVATGIIEGGVVEVLDPALSGVVVTLGQHLLADGSPVVLPEPKPARAPAAAATATTAPGAVGTGGRP